MQVKIQIKTPNDLLNIFRVVIKKNIPICLLSRVNNSGFKLNYYNNELTYEEFPLNVLSSCNFSKTYIALDNTETLLYYCNKMHSLLNAQDFLFDSDIVRELRRYKIDSVLNDSR